LTRTISPAPATADHQHLTNKSAPLPSLHIARLLSTRLQAPNAGGASPPQHTHNKSPSTAECICVLPLNSREFQPRCPHLLNKPGEYSVHKPNIHTITQPPLSPPGDPPP
jgi:hypothetical protein